MGFRTVSAIEDTCACTLSGLSLNTKDQLIKAPASSYSWEDGQHPADADTRRATPSSPLHTHFRM
jgi:hypothetical protein